MYEWVASSVELSKNVFQEFSLDWDFNLSEPASIKEVNDCEQMLGLSFPSSYRDFLLKYNGAHFFCSHTGNLSNTYSWWADSGIVIFGTKVLVEYWLEYERNCRENFADTEEYPQAYPLPLPIAYLGRVGTGDFCALNRDELIESEYPVIDCDHELPPCDWKKTIISNSFEEWLRKMFKRVIEHKSLPEYWFEDTLHDRSLNRMQ